MYLLLDIFLWLLAGASVIWAFAPPICSIMGLWRVTAVALCLGGLTYLFFLSVLFPMAVRSLIAKANSSGNSADEPS